MKGSCQVRSLMHQESGSDKMMRQCCMNIMDARDYMSLKRTNTVLQIIALDWLQGFEEYSTEK